MSNVPPAKSLTTRKKATKPSSLSDALTGSSRRTAKGASLLNHPAHEADAEQVRDALRNCRDQGLFPNWKAWAAVLQERDLSVSEWSIRRWCEADDAARGLLAEIRMTDG